MKRPSEIQRRSRIICSHPRCSLLIAAALLTGCGSGSSDDPPAQTSNPPPTESGAPPRAATAVSLDDGHTVGSIHWEDGATSSGGQGQAVGELECGDVDTTYHVHTHLSIFLNDEALAVPAEIGIVETSPDNGCVYPIHTHNRSGLLHLEGPEPRTFTLGQFFGIWGQPLEPDNVAGIMSPVVIYITDDDDVVTEHDGDFAEIELISHREITIQIGTEITEIPNFTWSGD